MIKIYPSAQILFNQAQSMGLNPTWATPHGLFSFEHDGQDKDVFYTKLHLNSQLGSWMCQDKYLTHIMAQKHDLPDIPFCYTSKISDVHTFLDTYGTIIQKPVLGQQSEGAQLIQNQDEIKNDHLDEWVFEKYISGIEYRCLVLNSLIIGVQEKCLIPTDDQPWKKTYRILEEPEWNPEMVHISIKIAKIFHMGLVAVDFILGEDNKVWLLEANSTPGLDSFHNPDKGKSIPVAKMILEAILKD